MSVRCALLLALLLPACHPPHDLPGDAGPISDPIADGKTLYTATCASCHLENGDGLPGLHPPLDGSPLVNGRPDPLAAILLFGLRGPMEVNGIRYNGVMPMWKDTLNDRQIAAVLTYTRQAWGNRASAISPHEVSQVRNEHPHQNSFLTPEELKRFDPAPSSMTDGTLPDRPPPAAVLR